jgi:hypothetical protein
MRSPNAVWHASPHACFLSRLSPRAPRLAVADPGELRAHVHARVFLVRARVRRDPPRAGERQVVQRRVLIARGQLQVAVHGVDAVVPLREGRRFVSFFLVKRREKTWDARRTGATRAWNLEFDIRATRGWWRVRARATARARGFRAARRDRAFGSFRCARVPATASSRSRSCPRNTPSALRSGTLSWKEIAASNARLRRRTHARGRGGK